VHYWDAEFNVTKVAGTEGLDLAAGDAGGSFSMDDDDDDRIIIAKHIQYIMKQYQNNHNGMRKTEWQKMSNRFITVIE